ncbi:CPP1-like family protein [Spirulina sp. CCNP1310]|uniref:CPP1-like family protein n=1 Tax=Spirulina sp. CCNP1310 TaxID=3110249 RepID=UPI002B21121A|nr:CPP1-like family protein [Spirulina sp. CCNP1310]MEA5417702.1 CPP1-like family protein [Spirulina sp. CCNP1310]
MSEQNPYQTLGVTTESSFEEIQTARNRLSQEQGGDRQAVDRIEAAYDAIIMDRLKLRQEGKIKVPDGIRFPKPPVAPTPVATGTTSPSLGWLQDYLDTPGQGDILWPAVVFGVGVGLVLLAQSAKDPILALVLTFALGANIYFLVRKEKRFGRSLLISFLGLVLGVGIGTVLVNLSGVPLGNGGLSAPQVVNIVTLILFWLSSSFLR